MADTNTIIEGTVKFRDGKKWKSRWCVMRRLSPVADCVHVQLYRDARARRGGVGGCKASLSLQQYLGCETGFTLDKQSNTLALLCRDFVAVLAFETRERLIQWQVKVCTQLGSARQYVVLVVAGGSVRSGPARLLLHGERAALTAGVPPRLLGLWELAHLRRYGVVEGRFCFEGGSLCGRGEGLHVLITDQAKELEHDFHLASLGRLSPSRRPFNNKNNNGAESPSRQRGYHSNARLTELNTIDRSISHADCRLYEDPCTDENVTAISPYWPSTERIHFQDMGFGDTASVKETAEALVMTPWNATGNVTLERCKSCMSKLGALSRSSTAALTPGAKHFNPAWTMESLQESSFKNPSNNDTALVCDSCVDFTRQPDRPPKPTHLELNLSKKSEKSLAAQTCNCRILDTLAPSNTSDPYDNYDVPKLPSAENEGQYYDTPKMLKESLSNELFQMAKHSVPNAVIMKKPCGCLLKFGKKRNEPAIVDTEETARPTGCPCRRVTDWANNWIKLPYSRRSAVSAESLAPNKENLTPQDRVSAALYATIDLSQKTKKRAEVDSARDQDCIAASGTRGDFDTRLVEIDVGPLAHYENLNFALSLEHYENAKDLLMSAGVTRSELDAIRNNLTLCEVPPCRACAGTVPRTHNSTYADDYLTMEPSTTEGIKRERALPLPSGYTPMSPLGRRTGTTSPLDDKSASNLSLGAPHTGVAVQRQSRDIGARPNSRQRSTSADSSRFLDDYRTLEDRHSSAETLRVITEGSAGVPLGCMCVPNKHSDADSSEALKGRAGGCVSGNRDSSSSNDSGVSSCSTRHADTELPVTTCTSKRHYRSLRQVSGRRCWSTDMLESHRGDTRGAKSSSAEAEVPVLVRTHRGTDAHSTSSGTSDMSDYIETLSICSSHSSTDAPVTMRVLRQTARTLRPRSGNEYQNVDARCVGGAGLPAGHDRYLSSGHR